MKAVFKNQILTHGMRNSFSSFLPLPLLINLLPANKYKQLHHIAVTVFIQATNLFYAFTFKQETSR
jgi:hypothetical protein